MELKRTNKTKPKGINFYKELMIFLVVLLRKYL